MLDGDAVRRDKRRTATVTALKSRHRRTVCKTRLKRKKFVFSSHSYNFSQNPFRVRLFTWFHFAREQTARFRDEPVHVRIGPFPQVHFHRQYVAYKTERRQRTMQKQREQTSVVLQLFCIEQRKFYFYARRNHKMFD